MPAFQVKCRSSKQQTNINECLSIKTVILRIANDVLDGALIETETDVQKVIAAINNNEYDLYDGSEVQKEFF